MSDRSKVIFGNEMSGKVIKKAERSKAKFARKYGDDSAAQYTAKLVENRTLCAPFGVRDIRVNEGENDVPFDTEKGIIVANIRMGFGHYRISIAMASAAHALGYELDVRDMTKAQKRSVKAQIALYNVWREVFRTGQFYRGRTGNLHEWTAVAPDGMSAVGMIFQELSRPNVQYECYRPIGLDPDRTYRLYNISGAVNVKLFGSLINTMAPIHVKQDSLLHNMIARVVKMGEEKEDYTAKGATLMRGISLSQGFSGTGYSDKVRLFPDFASRMYFMLAVE